MKRFFSVLALLLVPATGAAQDFYTGLEAANAGDFSAAVREWTPIAQQGHEVAQHNLAVLYEKGQGVPQDFVEAAKWYRLAAGQGNVSAQSNLGLLYERGLGVPQDSAEAAKLYRLA